jgi:hypothetical protein
MRNEIYHTPGPWHLARPWTIREPNGHDLTRIPIHGPKGEHIADCLEWDGDLPENKDEIRANARLIAAAPELLEVVEGIARTACLRQFIGNKCICWSCKAKAAIAKAKGF